VQTLRPDGVPPPHAEQFHFGHSTNALRTSNSGLALLFSLAAVYCVASLAHFVHNAEYLAQYPNMPIWLSRSKVYAAWLAITAVGALGLAFVHGRHVVAGILLIAVYAAFGFDGLGHYALAPISSHTLAMNLTIWFEVVAAAALLFVALRCMFRAGQRYGFG
jgi:hypothetical protein